MAEVQTTPSAKPQRKTASQKRSAARRTTPPASQAHSDALRTTKHDLILSLLSRRDGATIPDLMEATGWQQHSIRGFLAATIKKKLGLNLTSTKVDGELRRYRVTKSKAR